MIQSFIKSFVCIKRISLVVYHIIQSWVCHFYMSHLYLSQFFETFCASTTRVVVTFVQFFMFFTTIIVIILCRWRKHAFLKPDGALHSADTISSSYKCLPCSLLHMRALQLQCATSIPLCACVDLHRQCQ